ncbi:hypothetical protein HJC23_000243 [Cyclotella cryptica]|uniref:Uncharacterized protein n=1 Tax=Cyclotella cryptica TaxID=29204 RepID=A0ABD3QCP0_9STRA|eukprot:CCRYP_006788-RA/>CCRYP_006788-RA protein AED:0.08 eAED:0.08 QI:0/-1/0/1/-1/1/1/0/829
MSDSSYSANNDDNDDTSSSSSSSAQNNNQNNTKPKTIETNRTTNTRAFPSSIAPPHRKCIIRHCHKYRNRNRMCIRHNKEYHGKPPRRVVDQGYDVDSDNDDSSHDDMDESTKQSTEKTPQRNATPLHQEQSHSAPPYRYKLCILKSCRSRIHQDDIEITHGMCRKHYTKYRVQSFPSELVVRRNWRWSTTHSRGKRSRDPEDDVEEDASSGIPSNGAASHGSSSDHNVKNTHHDDDKDAPIRNISMLHSKLLHNSTTYNQDECSSITSIHSQSTVPSDDNDNNDHDHGASQVPPQKKKKGKASTTHRYCCIRRCPRKIHSNSWDDGLCRKHFLFFGMYPPPELKGPLTKRWNYGCDSKNDRDEAISKVDSDPIAAQDAAMEETERLYKAYYFARKNREWRLSHGGTDTQHAASKRSKKRGAEDERYEMEQEKLSATSFPLEMQRKFAKLRKTCILQSKKDWNGHVMTKRLGRESETLAGCHEKIPSSHPSLLYRRGGIPATLAKQIIHNIKQQDLSAIDNVYDAVVLEAQRVTGLPDDADGTSFANYVKQRQKYSCHDALDWDWCGQGGDGKGNIYQHMSIDMIDDFVGWATSLSAKDRAKPTVKDSAMPEGAGEEDEAVYSGGIHVPKAPPPPSQIAFLRHRLQKALVERCKVLYPDESMENHSKRAEVLLGCLDSSALVSIGITIEEVMTAALMPLAKAHVERCRRLERLNNLQSHDGLEQEDKEGTTQSCMDPFVAWTLPIVEAITELARDESTNHETCNLLSSKPPYAVLKSDGSVQFINSLVKSNACSESLSQWVQLHGINGLNSCLKNGNKHAELLDLLCSG